MTREQQVEALIATGADNKCIAAQLGISLHTVKTYASRIFLRYGFAGRSKRIRLIRAIIGSRFTKPAGWKNLTPKEQAVALLILEGFTNRELAEDMFTTEGTIRNCSTAIYDKLGVFNRYELAIMCLT